MKQHPARKPKGQTPVRDFFTLPEAELIARRREVWGLLEWYHNAIVLPNRGLRGFLRRCWWRVTGQRSKLISPWAQLRLAIAAQAAQQQAEAVAPDTNGAGPSIEVVSK